MAQQKSIKYFLDAFILFVIVHLISIFHRAFQKVFSVKGRVSADSRLKHSLTLLSAAESGQILEVEKSLAQGASVDTLDRVNETTPLMHAAKKGHLINCILLVAAGAQIDRMNRGGLTPLMLSVIGNHYFVFGYVLDQGANLLIRSEQGYTVVQWAIVYERLDILSFLKIKGINFQHHTHKNGNTPFLTAVIAGKLKVVQFLLRNGSLLDEINDKGESAFTLAKKFGHAAIYEFLNKKLVQGKKLKSSRGASASIAEIRLELAQLHYANKNLFFKSKTREKIELPSLSLTPRKQQLDTTRVRRNRTAQLKRDKVSSTIAIESKNRLMVGHDYQVTSSIHSEGASDDHRSLSFDAGFLKPINSAIDMSVLHHFVQNVMVILASKEVETYLVGGWIRDYFLKKKSNDFDIITRLPIRIVSTLLSIGWQSKNVRNLYKITHADISIDILCDELFDIYRDAQERDFSCNALYLNIKGQLYEPIEGSKRDIDRKVAVTLGDPILRFKDDPIRMVRLARLVGECKFTYGSRIVEAVRQQGHMLRGIDPKKLQYHIRKLFLTNSAVGNFNALVKLNLLNVLFPAVRVRCLTEAKFVSWIVTKLQLTDQLVEMRQPVSLHYVYAVFHVANRHVCDEVTPEANEREQSSERDTYIFDFFQKVDRVSQHLISELSRNNDVKAMAHRQP